MMHAGDATDIARGIKCCNGRIVDTDFASDDREHVFYHVGIWNRDLSR